MKRILLLLTVLFGCTFTIEAAIIDWRQRTIAAPFGDIYAHSSVNYADKVWVIAGFTVHLNRNTVYSSSNGADWVLVTGNAQFSARESAASVVFNSKMWVIGGYDSDSNSVNDSWYSTDGIEWQAATQNAAFAGRSSHECVVFDNKIWVIAGSGIDGKYNDVWYSSDGIDWVLATGNAGFSPRVGHTAIVFDSKIWVIGGYDTGFLNDTWYSDNGIDWVLATGNAGFDPRFEHSSILYDNKMWVFGGTDGSSFSDSWYSSDGVNWITTTIYSSTFSSRYSASVVFIGGRPLLIGGHSGIIRYDDAWWVRWYQGDTTSTATPTATITPTAIPTATPTPDIVVYDTSLTIAQGAVYIDTTDGTEVVSLAEHATWFANGYHVFCNRDTISGNIDIFVTKSLDPMQFTIRFKYRDTHLPVDCSAAPVWVYWTAVKTQ